MVDTILIENQKEGTPREIWDAPSSDQIEGFATDISVNHGEHIDFKINVNAAPGVDVPYHIEIYRLGYYGGDGAHLVYSSQDTGALAGHAQPDPIFDPTTGLVDAGNWSVSTGWNVPADAVSGVYLVKLVRDDNGATNQIPFIVRNDDGPKSDIILQTSDTTWQAYNGWAGNNGQVGGNFYGDPSGTIDHPDVADPGAGAQDRAYAVSYNRPIITRDGGGAAAGAQDYLFGADFAAIYWLEKNGYDVSYISGVDTDRLGADYLTGHKAFISVGHDEYWSGQQRLNVEDARDAGVNLLFWSGNEVYWKTRFEDAISPDGTAYRTLVCYKETWANADPNAGPEDYANIDPTNDWTGTWRDMRFVDAVDAQGNYIAGGSRLNTSISGSTPDCFCLTGAGPETTLTGQLFGPDGTGEFGAAIDVPAALAGLRVWRDTTVASTGQLGIAPGILGYEWDVAPSDEFRPAGLIKLSETVDVPWSGILVDQGNKIQPGVATHNLSLYRAESGALVFSAGTVFWSWALSDQHDSSPYVANIENVALQQFAVNMFADMGIQAGVTDAILASQGLVRAVGITDAVAARATLNDIPDTVHNFQTVVISGTATDDDGNALTDDGRVAVVEISIDNGATWKVAQGTTNWSYTWRPTTEGTYTIKARAIDDSLNIGNIIPAQDTVTVIAPTTFSLFNPALPVNAGVFNDGQPLELGMKFSAHQDGQITELKYFRTAADAGDNDVREGHLWGPDGALLATVTFNSGSGQSGWQVASLSTPVAITAGSDYVVSYRTVNNYAATNDFFNPSNEVAFDGLDNDAFSDPSGMLSAPQSTVVGGGGFDGNGVYKAGAALVMPNETFNAANYWVDVTFDPTFDPAPNGAPSISPSNSFEAAENQTTVGVVTATDPDGDAIVYAIAGGADAAKFRINPTTGALAFLSAPDFEAPTDAGGDNVYNVNVSASDRKAAPVTQNVAVTVTDVVAEVLPNTFSLFNSALPVNAGVFNDGQPLELGMKFSAHQDGQITELKYFRTAADAGDNDVREGHLWGPDGALLATVTFNSGSGQSGWQVASLSTPVAITAGSEYVVSYRTVNNYAATNDFFNPSNEVAFDGLDNDAFSDPSGMLSAPQSTVVGGGGFDGNGVYKAGAALVMPNETFNAANYWVDVTFDPTFDPAPNGAPSISPSNSFEAAENQTTVGVVTATDPDGDAIVYAVSGGADAAKFRINPTTGALAFLSAPDFEAPTDAGGDNVYNVNVSASDRKAAPVTQNVAVTVTDVVTEVSLFNPALPVNAGVFNDGQPLELGMKFSAHQDGQITELKYFRTAADAGDNDVREGHLWGPDGALLATVTFNSGSGQSGWQVASLSTPVAITAGSDYVVSYRTVNNYAATNDFFNPSNEVAFDGLDNEAFSDPSGMLSAPQSTVVGGGGLDGNGVYKVGAALVMPNETFNAANYWVDVIFHPTFDPTPNGAPSISPSNSFEAAENQTTVGVVTATDPDGDAIVYAVSGGADAAKFRINPTTGALAFLSAPDFEAPTDAGGDNVYNVNVSASDGKAAPVTQNVAVTVTDVVTEVSLFNPALPVNAGVFNDGQPLELGMKFSAHQDGQITELKYFRTAADAGDNDVREGHLWGPDGALLATVTFNSGSGQSGWQVASLSTPVAITAGSDYVVSYRTVNNYAATNDFFNPSNEVAFDGLDNDAFSDPSGMLSAPQSTVVGGGGLDGNGVYKVGAALVMPNETFNAANYWVDVIFHPTFDPTPNGAPSISPSNSFEAAENQTTVGVVTATDPDGDAIVYAVSGGADAAKFRINPTTGALAFLSAPDFEAPTDAGGDNVYNVNVSASDGKAAPVTQNVAVTVTDVVTEVSLFNPALPVNAGVFNDGQPLELGMKFSAHQDGQITELKYFRTAADAGDNDVREGHLWGPDGALLATVTFNSGSGQSGWQVASLSTPVAITAGSEYVVSYRTENNYAATSDFFNPSNEVAFDGLDNEAFSDPSGMLSAPQSAVVAGGGLDGNGVYKVGAALVMPNETFNAANYWVDVTFHL